MWRGGLPSPVPLPGASPGNSLRCWGGPVRRPRRHSPCHAIRMTPTPLSLGPLAPQPETLARGPAGVARSARASRACSCPRRPRLGARGLLPPRGEGRSPIRWLAAAGQGQAGLAERPRAWHLRAARGAWDRASGWLFPSTARWLPRYWGAGLGWRGLRSLGHDPDPRLLQRSHRLCLNLGARGGGGSPKPRPDVCGGEGPALTPVSGVALGEGPAEVGGFPSKEQEPVGTGRSFWGSGRRGVGWLGRWGPRDHEQQGTGCIRGTGQRV